MRCMPIFICSAALAVLTVSCGVSDSDSGPETFTFAVLDVGQGLAQLGSMQDRAVAWDMGPPEGYRGWREGYEDLGRPRLEAVVVSHSDLDHRGGMSRLGGGVDFSGLIVTSPHEDTTLIRSTSGAWSNKVRFRCVARGDTLGMLPGVYVECIWPPAEIDEKVPLNESGPKNAYSLCFRIVYDRTTVLITSDIDTTACGALSLSRNYELQADLFVVPHHGSRGSVDPVFFGYVAPLLAIVSCGPPPNRYGHPSDEVLDLLFEMGARVVGTYDRGHVVRTSNGEYWQR